MERLVNLSSFDQRDLPLDGLLIQGCLSPEHALEGLDAYSHVWVLFYFHRDASVERLSELREVQGDATENRRAEMQTFCDTDASATECHRTKLAEVDRVKHDVLYLRGADLIDGTPILDIKFLPHIDKPRTSVGTAKQAAVQASMPSWLVDLSTMSGLFKFPIRDGPIKCSKGSFRWATDKSHYKTIEEFMSLVSEILAGDPRSIYRKDKGVPNGSIS